MSLSTLSPYELGESNHEDAILYLVRYLKDGTDNEKRLAASAIMKLSTRFPYKCTVTYPYLIHNLSSGRPQVRQYALNALKSLPIDALSLSDNHLALVRRIMKDDEKEYNRKIAKQLNDRWAPNKRMQPKMKTIENIVVPQSNCFPEGATRKVIEKAEIAETLTTFELVNDHEKDAFYFRSLEKKGIKLNEPQLKATRHFKGPALVLAGAGSGKTRVLSSRAGHLISLRNVDPKNILLLTFTKKAAAEMTERISQLPGLTKSIVRDITSGTYHSIFLRVLRTQGDNRKILSVEKVKHLYIKLIMKEMALKDDYEPEYLLSVLSHHKNNMIPVGDMPEKTPIEKEVKEILKRYEKKKSDNGFMDFDDILLDTYHLLKHNEGVLKTLQRRCTYILCDEWQDTNPVQYELIKMIALPENNLFVVGDDDQTIFEFNGADSSIILNFSAKYPDTQTYQLNINYRSTTSIVGLANSVISYNERRYKKTLKATKENNNPPYFCRPMDANEEAELIVKNIINEVKQKQRTFGDFSVLFRANSNSRAVFDQLVMNDVPFVTFGDANIFYEQSLVKPVIDYLRLAIDGKNLDAANGVLTSLYLNKEKAFDFILSKDLLSPSDMVLVHLLELPNLKEYQKKQIFERIRLIRKLTEMPPVNAVKEIRGFYDKYLEADERKNLTVHKEMIQDTLSEIESSAVQFHTIQDYVNFVDEIIRKNKDMEVLRRDPKADVVKLMTIHKSKGLEFPVVYLIGASEGILPHSSSSDADSKNDLLVKRADKTSVAIEGERRLAYVAITRAEEELYISSPKIYRNKNVEVSRFIMDAFTERIVIQEKPEKRLRTTKIYHHSKTNPENTIVINKTEVEKPKETIMVWDCTNKSCNGWQRIRTYEETLIETKSCPLCNGTMIHSSREV